MNSGYIFVAVFFWYLQVWSGGILLLIEWGILPWLHPPRHIIKPCLLQLWPHPLQHSHDSCFSEVPQNVNVSIAVGDDHNPLCEASCWHV